MPNLSIRDVYIDPLLTNVSVKYTNSNFIADVIAPVVTVQKRTGIYFKYDKSNLKLRGSLRTALSRANRSLYGLTKVNYGPLLEHSLESPIEYDIMNEYDNPLDPLTDATEAVTEQMMIERENGLATDMGNASIVTQNTSLAGTARWDNALSNPFGDIETGIAVIKTNGIIQPNTIVFGYPVWQVIKQHTGLIERIKYTQTGVLTEDLVAALFNVKRVIVGDAVINNAGDGLTDSLGFIWGKNAWIMYVADQPGIRQVSGFYHLTLQNGRYVDRWDEPEVKSSFVRVNDYYQRVLVAPEAIYGIFTAVN